MDHTVTESQVQIPLGGGWCTLLGRNLYALYEKDQFTDATLSSRDGVRIRVHSCVLAASSSVLAKRMQSGFTIWIDAPSSALRSFLKFVYSGYVDMEDQSLDDVLKLVQEFEVVSIKHEACRQRKSSSSSRPCASHSAKKNSPTIKTEINHSKENGNHMQSAISGTPHHEMMTRSRSRPSDDIHARGVCHKTDTSGSSESSREQRTTSTKKVPKRHSGCGPKSSARASIAAVAKSTRTVQPSGKYVPETLEDHMSEPESRPDMEEVVNSNKEGTDKHSLNYTTVSPDMDPLESLESGYEKARVCSSTEIESGIWEMELVAEKDSKQPKGEENFETVKENHLEKGFANSNVKNTSAQNQENRTIQSGGKCQYCGTFWNTFSSLRRHEKTHIPVTLPYQCPECPQSFKTYGRLSIHKHSKHPDLSLEGSCNICGWVPRPDDESLQKHVKDNHSKKSSWQCEKCGKSFTQKSAMDIHIEAVHLKIEHRCSKCDYTTRFKYCLTYHVRKAHMGEAFFKHQCETCGQRFIRSTELKEHRLQQHTSSNEWQFNCSHCQKRFSSQRKLNCHMVYHRSMKNGSRRLKPCPECGQQFTASAMLEKHRHIVHLKDTACACDKCGKQFSHPSNLQRHMLRHTSSRNYKCTTCGVDFRLKEDLQKHERIHSAPKRFKCQYCDKLFLRKIFLQQHERIHTGEKPLQCNICKARFRCNGNLSSHKRKRHPVEHAKEQQLSAHRVREVNTECETTPEDVAENTNVVYEVVYTTEGSDTHIVQEQGDLVFQVMELQMEQKDEGLSADPEASEEGTFEGQVPVMIFRDSM